MNKGIKDAFEKIRHINLNPLLHYLINQKCKSHLFYTRIVMIILDFNTFKGK